MLWKNNRTMHRREMCFANVRCKVYLDGGGNDDDDDRGVKVVWPLLMLMALQIQFSSFYCFCLLLMAHAELLLTFGQRHDIVNIASDEFILSFHLVFFYVNSRNYDSMVWCFLYEKLCKWTENVLHSIYKAHSTAAYIVCWLDFFLDSLIKCNNFCCLQEEDENQPKQCNFFSVDGRFSKTTAAMAMLDVRLLNSGSAGTWHLPVCTMSNRWNGWKCVNICWRCARSSRKSE